MVPAEWSSVNHTAKSIHHLIKDKFNQIIDQFNGRKATSVKFYSILLNNLHPFYDRNGTSLKV